jgi:hypothetical protein
MLLLRKNRRSRGNGRDCRRRCAAAGQMQKVSSVHKPQVGVRILPYYLNLRQDTARKVSSAGKWLNRAILDTTQNICFETLTSPRDCCTSEDNLHTLRKTANAALLRLRPSGVLYLANDQIA